MDIFLVSGNNIIEISKNQEQKQSNKFIFSLYEKDDFFGPYLKTKRSGLLAIKALTK